MPLEAFLSGKPVLTTDDAGGPLEFVEDGVTGSSWRPGAGGDRRGARRRVGRRAPRSRRWGSAAARRVAALTWDAAVGALLAAAGSRA